MAGLSGSDLPVGGFVGVRCSTAETDCERGWQWHETSAVSQPGKQLEQRAIGGREQSQLGSSRCDFI